MDCVGHQSPGLGRHRRVRSADHKSLDHWADLARTPEREKPAELLGWAGL